MNAKPLFVGFEDGSEAERGSQRRLLLTPEQRATGMHVVGAPGTGKSKFLEWMVRGDISLGHGVAVVDPHGDLYDSIVGYCAATRPRRPIYLMNLSKGDPVFGFNPFQAGGGEISVQVDRCIEATIKAWGVQNTDETPLLERWLRCVYHTIIEGNDLTIAEAEPLLEHSNAVVRSYLTGATSVAAEWRALGKKSADHFDDKVQSTKNRLMRFYTARSALRFMALTDPAVNLDLGRLMDEGGMLLVNLKPSSALSAANARLFGTLLVTKFFDTARRREIRSGRPPRPFYLYLDEAQNYLTPDVAEMLAQGRKMGLALILAHQFLEQVRAEDPRILAALHGAARTKVVFGVGGNDDAKELVHELWPGQIDYQEVKRIEWSVKFWPVYGRDKVYTEAESHLHGSGGTSGASDLSSFAIGAGQQWLATGEPGASFESNISGGGSAHTEMSSWMEADGSSRGTADIPMLYPVPFEEGKVIEYTLEEQRQRLADTLRLQFQRNCFIRTPDGTCRPILVPRVVPVPLSAKRVAAYEDEINKKVGALTGEQVDRVIEARRGRIEVAALEFADRGNMVVDFQDDDHFHRATRPKSPKPTRGRG